MAGHKIPRTTLFLLAVAFFAFTAPASASPDDGWQGTVLTANLKVYAASSSTSRTVTILPKGENVRVLVETQVSGLRWCHVQLPGETEPAGYVICSGIQRSALQGTKSGQENSAVIPSQSTNATAPNSASQKPEQRPALATSATMTSVASPSPVATGALTNGDILSMTKAGLPADVLVAKIKSSMSTFDTSPAALSQLKTNGVADGVILAMVQAPTPTRTPDPPVVQAAVVVPTAPTSSPSPAIAVPVAVNPVVQNFSASGPYKVTYDGGSLGKVKAGQELKMFVEQGEVRLMDGKKEMATIPASSITEISYGQDVHRRVGTAVAVGLVSFGVGALTALSKSKKHFVGLTWADGDQKGGFAMQCDKNEYRGILAGLEGISGKKAINSENMNVKN